MNFDCKEAMRQCVFDALILHSWATGCHCQADVSFQGLRQAEDWECVEPIKGLATVDSRCNLQEALRTSLFHAWLVRDSLE
jgi:hypothetical protein